MSYKVPSIIAHEILRNSVGRVQRSKYSPLESLPEEPLMFASFPEPLPTHPYIFKTLESNKIAVACADGKRIFLRHKYVSEVVQKYGFFELPAVPNNEEVIDVFVDHGYVLVHTKEGNVYVHYSFLGITKAWQSTTLVDTVGSLYAWFMDIHPDNMQSGPWYLCTTDVKSIEIHPGFYNAAEHGILLRNNGDICVATNATNFNTEDRKIEGISLTGIRLLKGSVTTYYTPWTTIKNVPTAKKVFLSNAFVYSSGMDMGYTTEDDNFYYLNKWDVGTLFGGGQLFPSHPAGFSLLTGGVRDLYIDSSHMIVNRINNQVDICIVAEVPMAGWVDYNTNKNIFIPFSGVGAVSTNRVFGSHTTGSDQGFITVVNDANELWVGGYVNYFTSVSLGIGALTQDAYGASKIPMTKIMDGVKRVFVQRIGFVVEKTNGTIAQSGTAGLEPGYITHEYFQDTRTTPVELWPSAGNNDPSLMKIAYEVGHFRTIKDVYAAVTYDGSVIHVKNTYTPEFSACFALPPVPNGEIVKKLFLKTSRELKESDLTQVSPTTLSVVVLTTIGNVYASPCVTDPNSLGTVPVRYTPFFMPADDSRPYNLRTWYSVGSGYLDISFDHESVASFSTFTKACIFLKTDGSIQLGGELLNAGGSTVTDFSGGTIPAPRAFGTYSTPLGEITIPPHPTKVAQEVQVASISVAGKKVAFAVRFTDGTLMVTSTTSPWFTLPELVQDFFLGWIDKDLSGYSACLDYVVQTTGEMRRKLYYLGSSGVSPMTEYTAEPLYTFPTTNGKFSTVFSPYRTLFIDGSNNLCMRKHDHTQWAGSPNTRTVYQENGNGQDTVSPRGPLHVWSGSAQGAIYPYLGTPDGKTDYVHSTLYTLLDNVKWARGDKFGIVAVKNDNSIWYCGEQGLGSNEHHVTTFTQFAPGTTATSYLPKDEQI